MKSISRSILNTALTSELVLYIICSTEVARKRWCDAMWEKIMQQRLSLGLSFASTVVAVTVGILLWNSIENSNQSHAAQLSRQQDTILSMLSRIEPRNKVVPNSDAWAPLDILLISETGEPVGGSVQIKNAASSTAHYAIKMNMIADSQGFAHLGQIPWGEYDITVSLPELCVSTKQTIQFRPGEPKQINFICPTMVPQSVVQFEADPTEEQIKRHQAYVVTFSQTTQVGNRSWIIKNGELQTALIDERGRYLGRVLHDFYLMEKKNFIDLYAKNNAMQDYEQNQIYEKILELHPLPADKPRIRDQYFDFSSSIYRFERKPLLILGNNSKVTVKCVSRLRFVDDPENSTASATPDDAMQTVIALQVSQFSGEIAWQIRAGSTDSVPCRLETRSEEWKSYDISSIYFNEFLERYWKL